MGETEVEKELREAKIAWVKAWQTCEQLDLDLRWARQREREAEERVRAAEEAYTREGGRVK